MTWTPRTFRYWLVTYETCGGERRSVSAERHARRSPTLTVLLRR